MKLGALDATIKATGDAGEFEAILSMPTLDRDAEIIDPYAFAPLPTKITIDVDHGMSVAATVGSGTPYYTPDGVLMVRGTFASTPRAQEVRTLVREGHVDRMSVAYRAARYEIDPGDGVMHLRSGELLNAAIVAIPANREAAITAVKGTCPACAAKTADTDPDATAAPDAAVEPPVTATASALASMAEAEALLL